MTGKSSKRNSSAVVILSSDDEEDFDIKPVVPITTTRKNPKRRKPIAHSPPSQHTPFHQVKLLCEELNQGFTQVKVSSSGSGNSTDQWVDKYKPCSLDDLAVHKKKVQEVKTWFEERLRKTKETSCSNVILISGQPGVGKSATIYAIASHLGAEVYEWNTPTPRLWQEHLHTSSSGLSYMSKLAEFESFVESIRKYGLVSTTSSKSVIVLIDDLPLVIEKTSCERLNRCLHLLLQSVCHPTVILINDYGKSDSVEQHARYWEQLQSSLQSAGAFKVAFNPITVNSIKKVLTRIRKLELFEVSDEHIDLIAKASGGDIRHAITSLQYFSLKSHSFNSSSAQRRFLTGSEASGGKSGHLEDDVALPFGKDATLSLFHALGKFLHNKRDNESLVSSGEEVIRLKERFVRCPVKMDAPEIVLSQAHGQTRLVIDFLHENVLDFINKEAIEEACDVAEYLSDADILLAQQAGTSRFDAENFIQSVASSVAVRGVLFGNTQPISSRWHAIRRPNLWQVQQSSWKNKFHMLNQTRDIHPSMGLSKLSVIATEFRPALNWLGHGVAGKIVLDEFGSNDLVDDATDTDEDDIEDW